MAQLEHVLACQDMVGECPVWSVEEEALYWVDILGGRFHRYHPGTGTYETYSVGVSVGAIALRASGGLVMATGKGFALYDLSSRTTSFLAHPQVASSHMRFNDGNVDCRGRFWAGTVSTVGQWDLMQGELYRLDPDGSVHIMDTHFALINGIGWSPDNQVMYVVDSIGKCVYRYDFAPDAGSITHRRLLLDTSGEMGVPDGLAVDAEGTLWIAYWDGWKIVRYDPSGKHIAELELPVQCPACCAFGGPSLDELYITTAWEELSEEQRASQPFAGDLFRVRAGVKGMPRPLFLG